MKLQDAIRQMKPGNKLQRIGLPGQSLFEKVKRECSEEVNFLGEHGGLYTHHWLANDWQIIKPEPEVLSIAELRNKHGIYGNQRPSTTMGDPMKRYRLKIPEMIRREDDDISRALRVKLACNDGEVITSEWAYGTRRFGDIPSDWLEEIKDEPVSAEEIAKENAIYEYNESPREHAIRFVKAGEANERLRHRPQQTFQEWLRNETSGPHGETPSKQTVWEASETNRGFEPDRYGETCPKATKKDKPVSAEEDGDKWFSRRYPDFRAQFDDGTMQSYREAYIEGHEDGEANERLRHRPQQTFDEWARREGYSLIAYERDEAIGQLIWNACLKAHNLEQ